MRESGFLPAADEQLVEKVLANSCKLFQTAAVFFAGAAALLFEFVGPRLSHSIGYLTFSVGILCLLNQNLVYLGMTLQGFASVCLLFSVLHLSNLFVTSNQIVLAVLFAACSELPAVVFPALRLSTALSATALILLLATVVPVLGVIATMGLFPKQQPYQPVSESVRREMISYTGTCEYLPAHFKLIQLDALHDVISSV